MTEQNNMTADERYCFDCIHNEVCRYCPREYCDYKEQACTLESPDADDWISVKDRLPEYDKTVLVVNEDGYMHTAVRIKGSIAKIDEWQIKFGVYFIDNDVWEEDESGKITHWQYLPEPPESEDNAE